MIDAVYDWAPPMAGIGMVSSLVKLFIQRPNLNNQNGDSNTTSKQPGSGKRIPTVRAKTDAALVAGRDLKIRFYGHRCFLR